jgi:hypothetical protein
LLNKRFDERRDPGWPAQVLDVWRANRFGLVIIEAILEAVREVLCRPHIRQRYQWIQEEIDAFLAGLGELAAITPGELEVNVVTDAPDDNKYLACALEG